MNPKHEPVMERKTGAKEVRKERCDMISDMVDIGVKQVDIAHYYGMLQSTVCNIVSCGCVEKEKETRN